MMNQNKTANKSQLGTSIDGLLATKPNWTETHATSTGWVDSKTGELLVAIKGLDTKLTPVKRGRGRPRKGT